MIQLLDKMKCILNKMWCLALNPGTEKKTLMEKLMKCE